MSSELRFAVIGAGRIGLVHSGSVTDTNGAKLEYVVDPIKESAESVAKQFGCKFSTNPLEVINSGEIDAIIIGSPTPTHVPFMEAAIDARLHVLCEKPIDLDIKNVNQLREKVNKANTKVAIGFNRRLDPEFYAVKKRVEKGDVGKVEQVLIISRDPGPAPQSYIAVSGGIFRDMTIHDFDMARNFVPDIIEVSATGANSFCDYIKEETLFYSPCFFFLPFQIKNSTPPATTATAPSMAAKPSMLGASDGMRIGDDAPADCCPEDVADSLRGTHADGCSGAVGAAGVAGCTSCCTLADMAYAVKFLASEGRTHWFAL